MTPHSTGPDRAWTEANTFAPPPDVRGVGDATLICGRGLLDRPGRRLQSRDAAPQQRRLPLPTGPLVHRWQTALTPRSA